MIAITAKRLLTPIQSIDQPLLLIDDGRLCEVTSAKSRALPQNCQMVDFKDAVLVPGFVDIHIHGAAGRDVMESDPQAISLIGQFLRMQGVTSFLPTTVTAPLDSTLTALEHLADAVEGAERHHDFGARPLGIHLEGPFLSHRRRGVHPPQHLQVPSVALFEKLWQAARGHIRVLTIAPELEGAADVIAEATARGVCVSLGHSDADFAAACAGIAAGARHATHTFNAMRPFSHRDPGIVGVVLTDPRLSADIIADGIHVDPAGVRLFLQSKGVERSVLITDATAATGMPPGHYRMGNFEFEVQDGKCMANGVLAGSILTLDKAVRNVMHFANWDLQSAVRAATWNPAQAAGLPNCGSLQPGASADIVVLSPSGEVQRTISGGRLREAAVSD